LWDADARDLGGRPRFFGAVASGVVVVVVYPAVAESYVVSAEFFDTFVVGVVGGRRLASMLGGMDNFILRDGFGGKVELVVGVGVGGG